MKATLLLVLVMAITTTTCYRNTSDYITWMKEDFSGWHKFFLNRSLKAELLTNIEAKAAVPQISTIMKNSLEKVVQFQADELQTTQMFTEGTSAQGCVEGLKNYMSDAIQDEISHYEECSSNAMSRLLRQSSVLKEMVEDYQTAFQRVLTGIDKCAEVYHNKESSSRLERCLDLVKGNYLKISEDVKDYSNNSPSMETFFFTVVDCADVSKESVIAKGWNFLRKLVRCTELNDNPKLTLNETEVFKEFSKTLSSGNLATQITWAQEFKRYQVNQIDLKMSLYYIVKRTLEKQYMIESRSQTDYSDKLQWHLWSYFSEVEAISIDNPRSSECTSAALQALNNITNTSSATALECDQNVIRHTKTLIENITNAFNEVNTALPYMGNSAIISCFTKGYIFADNTIYDCYELMYAEFNVNFTKTMDGILDNVATLLKYQNFFKNSSLPCFGSILSKARMEAERAMHNLRRCLYVNSGIKYEMTTYKAIFDPSTPSTNDTSIH